ncbi:hypothetical protein CPBF367_07330 [Xanthomonas arboricola pv. juglandis]|nr:hypothetical protein CPBF367_07330 [Xanthomonas arboricola pv. juglandis]
MSRSVLHVAAIHDHFSGDAMTLATGSTSARRLYVQSLDKEL